MAVAASAAAFLPGAAGQTRAERVDSGGGKKEMQMTALNKTTDRRPAPRQVFFLIGLVSLIGLGLISLPRQAGAAYVRNHPIILVQPDGETISCFVTGDEFWRRVHDARGYTILQNPVTGLYVYAAQVEDRVVPSDFRVGWFDPAALGIAKGLALSPPSPDEMRRVRPKGSPASSQEIIQAPRTGSLNNIVIFIRFGGETEFGDATSLYGDMFNSSTADDSSMYNYFREASYTQLAISTTFYPLPPGASVVSYEDSHPRGYYQPYSAVTNPIGYQNSSQLTSREHTLLKNAVDATSYQVPAGLDIDGDNDGLVDNVCFIVRGDSDGWGDLLWPHMWSLYSVSAYINGKRVYTYNFQLQTFLVARGVGVLCHEMFHSLGSPDLYRYYNQTIEPVGPWDIMAYDADPPQHMGVYMKQKYGTWVASIPTITTAGTYSLKPLTSSTNNGYRINSRLSTSEYYVVEYRKWIGPFESSVPGEGLLVYRINTTASGNANGPPDEVYIYRPNGTLTQNGNMYSANYSQAVGRTAINDSTNPPGFLSDGSKGGLDISGIGAAGETISFTVSFGASLTVTAPAAGANWSLKSAQTIAWTASGSQNANVKIFLYKGSSRVKTISTKTPNDGTFAWTVPADLTPATDYRVRVRTVDNLLSDYSDYFTISKPSLKVTSPATGAVWGRNTAQTITWTVKGTMNANVKIHLFRGATLVQTIAATTPNNGSFPWTVPGSLTRASDYKIRVRTVDNAVTGKSGSFRIN